MLFIHLVFHNYGLEKSAVVSKALSLNAGTKYSILVKYFYKKYLDNRLPSYFFKFWRLLSRFLASDWLIHSAEQPIRSLQNSKKFTKKGEMVRLSTLFLYVFFGNTSPIKSSFSYLMKFFTRYLFVYFFQPCLPLFVWPLD